MGRSRARLGVLLAPLVILMLATGLWGCHDKQTETPLPTLAHSMKGYELYSWYEGGQWCYSLVVGTNRIKTFDEIAARDVRVEGVHALQEQLTRLPRGEQVFWSAGRVPGTTYPPAQMVAEVRAVCRQSGIDLEIVDWRE